MTALADRLSQIKPSATLAISAKALELKASGKNIISLSQGEPDFNTPEHICAAAKAAIDAAQTRYTAVDGTPELKAAIIDKLQRDNQLNYQKDQILVSSGAKQSIFNALLALINPGDEVIIPAPYWVSYPDMVRLAEGTPVTVTTSQTTNYKISAAQLEVAITDKTKLLILNTPSNPTGMCYTQAELVSLAQVLKQHPNIIILSDDIYELISWNDEPFKNIVMVEPSLYERTIVINGVSKAYAMTGWRIGYAAGPAAIIKAMKKIQSQSTSNACSVSQAAATAALNGDHECVKTMVKHFKERHDYFANALDALPGFSCKPAQGAFYCFADVSEAIKMSGHQDDVEFAAFVLEKAEVAAVPGSAFGAPGHLRFSYALALETLQEAIARLKAIL